MINNLYKIKELKLNPFTLAFPRPTEKKFLKDYYQNAARQVRIPIILCIFFVLSFVLVDYYVFPTLKNTFFLLRFGIFLPASLVLLAITYTKKFTKIYDFVIISVIFTTSLINIFFLYFSPERAGIFYSVGLLLIIFVSYTFLKLRFIWSLFSGWSIVLFYVLFVIFFTDSPYEYVLNNMFILCISNFFGMYVAYQNELNVRTDYDLKNKLKNESNFIKRGSLILEKAVRQRTTRLEEANENLRKEIEYRKEVEKILAKAKARAEEADMLKSTFLANMSHEIRTPMNGILGFSNLLRDDELSEEEREKYLNIIESSGNQLLTLINDIIDISMIEAGQVKIKESNVNINQLINNVYSLSKAEMKLREKEQLELRSFMACDDNTSNIIIDRVRLKQILINLINNAIKFTEKGYINFGYEKPVNKQLKFFVEDTGPGLPQNKKNQIFERFRQADELSTTNFGGTGLGLAISKGLVELLGGKIWVESQHGKGATFYFNLPYKPVHTQQEPTKKEKDILEYNWDKHTLLIVDDEPMILNYFDEVLGFTGIQIKHAENGKQAVEICTKSHEVDIVLMDIKMPELNGYEATKAIKSKRPEVVIIAQTAYAMAGEREKCLTAGCDDYISKPVKRNKILRLMDKYL